MEITEAIQKLIDIEKGKSPRSLVKRDELMEELDGQAEDIRTFIEDLSEAAEELLGYIDELRECERGDLIEFHGSVTSKAEDLRTMLGG